MKAAPARVKRRPSTSAVVVPLQPNSSSATRWMACFVSGKPWPSRHEDKPCRVTPRARSRTAGGRSGYASAATQRERRRLMLAVDMRAPSVLVLGELIAAPFEGGAQAFLLPDLGEFDADVRLCRIERRHHV